MVALGVAAWPLSPSQELLWPIWLLVPGLSQRAALENVHLPCVLHSLTSVLVTARGGPRTALHLYFELGEPCLHLGRY